MDVPLDQAPPIAWPSLSDLARVLDLDLSTLSRLVTARGANTMRIGREVKVSPPDAVDLLKDRGYSEDAANAQTRAIVQERMPGRFEATIEEFRPMDPDDPPAAFAPSNAGPVIGDIRERLMELAELDEIFGRLPHVPLEEYIRKDRDDEVDVEYED
jgi:hypothetical protein